MCTSESGRDGIKSSASPTTGDARTRPELAILGCLYHAHEPAPFDERVAVFRAAWVAIQSLDEHIAWRYVVVVMSLVSEAVVERGAAELREAGELDEGRWEEFTDSERFGYFFQRGHREGREEGREEGRTEQLRRSIVDVLELRGFELTAADRERIHACESLETLERWYAASKTGPVNRVAATLLR